MKLILEITEKNLGISSEETRFDKPYRLRKASRAIIFNDKKEIAFQFISSYNYHKLPGGGIEKGESIKEGLKREIIEEVGCDIDIGDEIGLIIEYRNEMDVTQISYCYFAEVKGEISEPAWEQDEIDAGYEAIWVSIDEAIRLMEDGKPKQYKDHFILKRDLTFLREAKKILENNHEK